MKLPCSTVRNCEDGVERDVLDRHVRRLTGWRLIGSPCQVVELGEGSIRVRSESSGSGVARCLIGRCLYTNTPASPIERADAVMVIRNASR